MRIYQRHETTPWQTMKTDAISLAGQMSGAIHPDRAVIWMSTKAPMVSVGAVPGASAKAVFSEVRARLERLVADGETSTIDLRFMKSMPDERATLAGLLGHGEVSAEVNSVGRSEVLETAMACVWLVRHYNSDAELVSELLEITDFPEILASDRQAAAHCLKVLNANAVPGIN